MTSELKQVDLDQLKEIGITPGELEDYKDELKSGFPPVDIVANASTHTGIHAFSESERQKYAEEYRRRKNVDVLKFVPASGAASRMFKDLVAYLKTGESTEKVRTFFDELKDYPFYEKLERIVSAEAMSAEDEVSRKKILEALLREEGLNYENLPKGMILFHRYAEGEVRTAFEEHFHEAAMYAANGNGKEARIHFTIPEETKSEVEEHLNGLSECLGKHLGVRFQIETSVQKPSTDTPAIYADTGEWVRKEDGSLLLRPAGHGALLENLNDLDAEIVFVKNIDNVVPDRLKDVTVKYKELLAGVLLFVRNKMFEYLRAAEEQHLDRDACAAFMTDWFPDNYARASADELYDIMNRPLRVCGMVQNEGEPGGGPFYVRDILTPSLQIVEKSQIDLENRDRAEIFETATHFNPVDLVLSLKDHRGESFDLKRYRNPSTGMVVDKSFDGRPIKALELPGLWNGGMYFWNTIFVEVPIETFNPVKTLFDLVRPDHR